MQTHGNSKGAMKNNTSDEVSHAALMVYPRIFGAGQNVQNIDFPKSVPYKNQNESESKTTTKEIRPQALG